MESKDSKAVLRLACMTLKPLLLISTAIAGSTLALSTIQPNEGFANDKRSTLSLAPQRIWVKTKTETDLNKIAKHLEIDPKNLLDLNPSTSADTIKSGHWICLPSSQKKRIKLSSIFDSSKILNHEPLNSPPPVVDKETVKVSLGETPKTIAKKHRITETELKELNPNLDLSKLRIGTKLRISKLNKKSPSTINWPHLHPLPNGIDTTDLFNNKNFIWPTKGVFTSGFGWRWGRMHKGIDIANNVGTPIFAAKNGIVSFSGWMGGYGYLVEMAHADGTVTRYAHNNTILVRKGQLVPQGANISLMGSTGRSTGPHLHFEIRKPGGAATDPMSMLPRQRA